MKVQFSTALLLLLLGVIPFLGDTCDPWCFPDDDDDDEEEETPEDFPPVCEVEVLFSLLSLSRVEHSVSILVLWSSSRRCAYRAPATSFRRNSCVS